MTAPNDGNETARLVRDEPDDDYCTCWWCWRRVHRPSHDFWGCRRDLLGWRR